MSRTAAVAYAVIAVLLILWLVLSADGPPAALLLGVGVVALVHLVGPRRLVSEDDHHIREQGKVRYGVNAPDRPRF